MKKIGIVTFHQALNYGAKLQAYALQQFLEKNGIENDVIDYTHEDEVPRHQERDVLA